jgi:hypothetical protein
MLALRTIIERYIVWITFLFVYTILAAVALYQGSVLSPDTGSYIRWADLLISYQFNYYRFYTDIEFFTPPFFYTLPVTLFAVLKLAMNDQWIVGYQIANLVALFFALFLYTKIACYLEIRKWLIAVSLLVFLVSIDFLLWPRYILTDTLFVLLVMLAIFAVTTRINKHYSSRILITALLLLLLIARPSSIPYIAVLLFFVYMPSLSQKMLVNKTLFLRLGICILLSSVFYSIVIMANASGFIESDTIDYWNKWVEKGVVIDSRPETYIIYEATYLGTAKLHLYRMVGFFTPFAKDFSVFHNILNGLLLLGCYVVILAMFRYSFSEFEQNNTRASATALLSTLIVFVAIFTSTILIDYDWRYRYPVIAPLILLTTLILDNYLNSREGKNNYGAR